MEKIIEYWPLYVALIAIIVIAALLIYTFIKMPTNQKLMKVKEWLLYAVTQAEKEFGSGTGQIKLRFVYDRFLIVFPYLAKIIPFELFSTLVDEALDKFRILLETNKQIQEYVEK